MGSQCSLEGETPSGPEKASTAPLLSCGAGGYVCFLFLVRPLFEGFHDVGGGEKLCLVLDAGDAVRIVAKGPPDDGLPLRNRDSLRLQLLFLPGRPVLNDVIHGAAKRLCDFLHKVLITQGKRQGNFGLLYFWRGHGAHVIAGLATGGLHGA